jgi:PHD/YefM family antitoxin component YafN of YafNO toxin-antitoxin module
MAMKALKIREAGAAQTLEPMSATTIRRDWSTAKDRLRAKGALALTTHDRVEAVLLEPAAYEALVARAEAADKALLDGLARQFDARLDALKQPDAAERLRSAFAREGRFEGTPVVGGSF